MFTIHAVLSQEISFLNKRIWFLNYPQSIFTWFLAQVKSSRAYVDPRRPIWMTLWGSRHPSSTARRKGVPWAIFSPSWVSRVSEWASIWTIPTGPYRSWNYKTTIVKLIQSQNLFKTKNFKHWKGKKPFAWNYLPTISFLWNFSYPLMTNKEMMSN